jgi:uncharacterized protein (UPF0262 family)
MILGDREEYLAPTMLHLRRARMSDNRIASLTLDEATVLSRNAEVEQERQIALRDLAEDSCFVPLRAVEHGNIGPWSLRLAVDHGRLAMAVHDGAGADAGTIGLGLARFRRVVREYFAICDSYYKALRRASPQEIETLDMARRAIHDRGTRQLLEALDGKIDTDFATARRLFTLICVLHIRA